MRVVCHLRAIREGKSLSLTEVSDLSGMNRADLSKIERGLQFPRDDERALIEHAYGVPASGWWEPDLLLLLQHDHEEQAAA